MSARGAARLAGDASQSSSATRAQGMAGARWQSRVALEVLDSPALSHRMPCAGRARARRGWAGRVWLVVGNRCASDRPPHDAARAPATHKPHGAGACTASHLARTRRSLCASVRRRSGLAASLAAAQVTPGPLRCAGRALKSVLRLPSTLARARSALRLSCRAARHLARSPSQSRTCDVDVGAAALASRPLLRPPVPTAHDAQHALSRLSARSPTFRAPPRFLRTPAWLLVMPTTRRHVACRLAAHHIRPAESGTEKAQGRGQPADGRGPAQRLLAAPAA
jgi:hypothetical protein